MLWATRNVEKCIPSEDGAEYLVAVWSLTLQTKITGLAMDMQVSWNYLFVLFMFHMDY